MQSQSEDITQQFLAFGNARVNPAQIIEIRRLHSKPKQHVDIDASLPGAPSADAPIDQMSI